MNNRGTIILAIESLDLDSIANEGNESNLFDKIEREKSLCKFGQEAEVLAQENVEKYFYCFK